MPKSDKPLISLVDVHKSFDDLDVLRGVDVDVHEGETLAVIGESGCGKTVLLKHILGLLRPDRGRVFFDGQDITDLPERDMVPIRTQFGLVFQMGALFDSLTVGENVAFALREHTHFDEDAIRERVGEKLDLVGLKGIEQKRPMELSGGMRKRVALARAIALNPRVVLYDEPTTGLDPIMSDVIDELIRRTQRKMRTTAVVVTHDMTSVNKVADRIVMLYEGKVVIDGTPDEVNHSDVDVVRQFIEGRAGDRIGSLPGAGEDA